ncbi:hypothetical protein Dvina_36090 [Dactylosporangium vinaceum]|uniref:Ankyrin repeat protein n=1 Tax=Dactylosporangium vinaceum TaxID=53362 RepID=A0ABV5MJ91_9ACTN|nr:hypothetical protein [Dactylosporangium vinaceum]UAB93626.1 hypothetical protein Dvina_36090 [Dactylosporangium vinaceum]
MGWDFRGLYTVGTAAARDRLTRDALVRGRFAEIPPAAAPDAALPAHGLLVVHGFGPHADDPVPWDAFWPAPGTAVAELPDEVRALDRPHRPPRNLVAWMRECAAATGAPMVLYECVMFAGTIEAEVALVCTATGTRLCDRATARTSPLIVMLEVLGARPRQWLFPPHERPFPHHLDAPPQQLARLSPSHAFRHDDPDVVDALIHRGAELTGASLCQAAEHGNPAIVERLLRAGAPLTPFPDDALGHAATPACARLLLAAGATADARTLASVTWRGFTDTARLLIDSGTPVDLAALWEPAVQGGVRFLVERALATDAPVDRPRGLLLATVYDRPAIVELLLAAGVRPTPEALAAAARDDRTAILRMLLAHVTPDATTAADPGTLPT